MAKLRIVYSFDLRSNAERAAQPSSLIRVPGIEYHSVDHDAVSTDVGKLLCSPDSRASHSTALMTAALILAALGVSQDQILAEYLLSAQRFEESCTAIRDSNPDVFRDSNRDVWEPLMKVDADYLTAAFDEMTASYGSVSGYLSNGLNVSAASLERIRSHLLE